MSNSTNPETRQQKPNRPIFVSIALLLMLIVAATPIPVLISFASSKPQGYLVVGKKEAIIPNNSLNKNNRNIIYKTVTTREAPVLNSNNPRLTDDDLSFNALTIAYLAAFLTFLTSPIFFTILAVLLFMRIVWIRPIYAIFALVELPVLTTSGGILVPPAIGAISAGLIIASIILLYLPASNRWFKVHSK
jgi:hypothetical protein